MSGYRYRPGRRDAHQAMADGAFAGVTLGTEHLLGVSSDLAPIEEGILVGTASASRQDTGTGAKGAVSYDTPYAIAQHERLDYQHDAGKQAKFLEQPMATERGVIADLVAQAIRDRLR